MRAADEAAGAELRVTDSTFEVLRAAWRKDANRGTRAWLPGCAVMCGVAATRSPIWRSRRVPGERLNRVVGWLLLRPAEVMRIES